MRFIRAVYNWVLEGVKETGGWGVMCFEVSGGDSCSRPKKIRREISTYNFRTLY